ncbi:MAG: hypothetical protein JKX76_01860 [Colwellia sp.]|nr:hypothetical protein [Colwellia sp.]
MKYLLLQEKYQTTYDHPNNNYSSDKYDEITKDELITFVSRCNHTQFSRIFNLSLQDFDVCKTGVKNHGVFLKYVQEYNFTRDQMYSLCLIACKHYRGAIDHVPMSCFTNEICMLNVKIETINGDSQLSKIPYAMRTSEMCYEAVVTMGNNASLEDVPPEVFNSTFVEDIYYDDEFPAYMVLKYVPSQFISYEMYIDLTLQYTIDFLDGEPLLSLIPEIHRTTQICRQVLELYDGLLVSDDCDINQEKIHIPVDVRVQLDNCFLNIPILFRKN